MDSSNASFRLFLHHEKTWILLIEIICWGKVRKPWSDKSCCSYSVNQMIGNQTSELMETSFKLKGEMQLVLFHIACLVKFNFLWNSPINSLKNILKVQNWSECVTVSILVPMWNSSIIGKMRVAKNWYDGFISHKIRGPPSESTHFTYSIQSQHNEESCFIHIISYCYIIHPLTMIRPLYVAYTSQIVLCQCNVDDVHKEPWLNYLVFLRIISSISRLEIFGK